MRYQFDDFVLDTRQYALCRGMTPIHVEPLVFDLLRLFVDEAGVLVDRDRMIAEVWDGRIVSEATLSSAVKAARKALGDSGDRQAFIETVRGRGFRFVRRVTREDDAAQDASPAPLPSSADREPATERRGAPSIAVLPFMVLGATGTFDGLAHAIPHDVILALSRLRWLFVIARGSSFRFDSATADLAAVQAALSVRYCVTGTLEVTGRALGVTVELAETETGGVVWAHRFSGNVDDVHQFRTDIVGGIAMALESQIQLAEAMAAMGKAPENLDAWQAFHLGLMQMHQYTADGNGAADILFRRAIALEPGFARAHAGLSFVHFQNAFMGYGPSRDREVDAARACAEKGLELDPLDPFSNFNMGRSYWLARDLDAALPWLERATSISPNYAQGIYSKGLVDSMAGRHDSASASADLAMELSPLDPLLYGMRGAKALARTTAGDFADAAKWGDAAARTPRAHVIIDMIAAYANTLAGNDTAAARWAETVRRRKPDANAAYFFDGLPIQHASTRRLIAEALARQGF